MKEKIALVLTLFITLVIFSSEIYFMPNYEHKPDSWHLFFPIMIISISFIIIFIFTIIKMIRNKKWDFLFLAQCIFPLVSFMIIRNINLNYIVLTILLFYLIIDLILKIKSNHKILNK